MSDSKKIAEVPHQKLTHINILFEWDTVRSLSLSYQVDTFTHRQVKFKLIEKIYSLKFNTNALVQSLQYVNVNCNVTVVVAPPRLPSKLLPFLVGSFAPRLVPG